MTRRSTFLLRLLSLAVTLIISVTQLSSAVGQTKSRNLSAPQIAKQTFPSVVVLITEDQSGDKYLGSGFFVDTDVLATNYHLIKGATKIVARRVGQRHAYQAFIIDFDEDRDLALLRLRGSIARPLTLSKGRVAVGDVVYVAGNPKGLEGTFSQGIVSALRGNDYVQITAPISRGSSGGPVMNSRGEVVGVAVGMIEEGQNLNFVVPVSDLAFLIGQNKRGSTHDFLDRLLREKEARTKDAGPAKSEPSLEETIAWLKERLEGSTHYSEVESGVVQRQIDRLSISISPQQAGPPLCRMYLVVKRSLEAVIILNLYSVFLDEAEKAEAGQDGNGNQGIWD